LKPLNHTPQFIHIRPPPRQSPNHKKTKSVKILLRLMYPSIRCFCDQREQKYGWRLAVRRTVTVYSVLCVVCFLLLSVRITLFIIQRIRFFRHGAGAEGLGVNDPETWGYVITKPVYLLMLAKREAGELTKSLKFDIIYR